MSVIENDVLMRQRDRNGNIIVNYPVTRAENVLGLEEKLPDPSEPRIASRIVRNTSHLRGIWSEDGTACTVHFANNGANTRTGASETQALRDWSGFIVPNWEVEHLTIIMGVSNNYTQTTTSGRILIPPNIRNVTIVGTGDNIAIPYFEFSTGANLHEDKPSVFVK